jgi:hypothetical protein
MNKIWMLGLLVLGIEQVQGSDTWLEGCLGSALETVMSDSLDEALNDKEASSVSGIIPSMPVAPLTMIPRLPIAAVLLVAGTPKTVALKILKDKKHQCSYCPKRFSDSSSLSRHKKMHEKQDANNARHKAIVFKCDFCEQAFDKHNERDTHQEGCMQEFEKTFDAAPETNFDDFDFLNEDLT